MVERGRPPITARVVYLVSMAATAASFVFGAIRLEEPGVRILSAIGAVAAMVGVGWAVVTIRRSLKSPRDAGAERSSAPALRSGSARRGVAARSMHA